MGPRETPIEDASGVDRIAGKPPSLPNAKAKPSAMRQNHANQARGQPGSKAKQPVDVIVFSVANRPVASRRSAPKSRAGCRECKRRHVKCDQGTPSCKRCVTAGRVCDLSLSQPRTRPSLGANQMESHANAIQLDTVAEKGRPLIDHRILTEPNRILSIFKDQAQWDMFHAFLFTNHQTGTLPINALSAMTPMIAQQEVAVREICCAVGAAGVAFTNPNSDPVADQKQYQLSLVYYNRAVQAIRGAEITTHTLLTVALVSILFITYDMIRGDMQTAYVHFDYCDRIIKSYFEKRCEEAGVPLAQIQLSTFESAVFEMFQRLTTYPWVLELGLDGSKVEHKIRKKCEGDLHRHRLRDMPQFFIDLPQALMWWDVTQHHLFHHHDFMDSSPVTGPEGISSTDTAWKESLAILQRWHNGFLPLFQTARQNQDEDPRPYLSTCVLEALYVETLAGLHLRHHPDTNVLPNARSIYFDMIKTARTMQQQWNPADGFLSLDNTIVRPLIFVLLKCRDADVRQAVEELVLEINQGSQLARPLLVMMSMDRNSKLPQKLRNVERAMGWYLTSCGCNSGLSSAL